MKDDDGTASKTVPVNNTEETTPADIDDLWRENFIKHAADQFEKNFQNLMQNGNYIYIFLKKYYFWIFQIGSESELGASFQKMAQTVANAIVDGETTDGEPTSADFQSAIAQALKDLSVTSENLQVTQKILNK